MWCWWKHFYGELQHSDSECLGESCLVEKRFGVNQRRKESSEKRLIHIEKGTTSEALPLVMSLSVLETAQMHV